MNDQYSIPRATSWDTKVLSTNFNSPQALPNVSTVSMSPTTNYVVPYSKYNAQISSQSYHNTRQIQPYQPPKFQSQGLEAAQPPKTNPTNTNQNGGWCAQHMSVTRVIGVLIGAIITGIPLAVMVTLYVLLDTTTTTTVTTASAGAGVTGSTTVSYAVPYQCITYSQISDSSRITTNYCPNCYCDGNSYIGWYRFTGLSGTQMVTDPVGYGYCGAYYPAWFNGTHPTTAYTTTLGTVCSYFSGNICYAPYSISAMPVTNCNGFYVYYLSSLGNCYARYCTK